jgi:hypothetical protein
MKERYKISQKLRLEYISLLYYHARAEKFPIVTGGNILVICSV